MMYLSLHKLLIEFPIISKLFNGDLLEVLMDTVITCYGFIVEAILMSSGQLRRVSELGRTVLSQDAIGSGQP